MPRFSYSPAMVEFLRDQYRVMALKDLVVVFNAEFGLAKTFSEIHSALKNHHIVSGRQGSEITRGHSRLFSPAQVAFIRTRYQDLTYTELAAALADAFGIAVTAGQIRTFVRNHHITCGRSGRFEKGNRSWNSGTKGQGLTGRNKTSFAKGNIPSNTRELGAERISKDGYVEVKVAEQNPYTGCPTRFKAKHVVVWEQANGQLPPGMMLRFLDGNPLNCDPANLVLISRGENAILNKSGLTGMPAEIMPSCIHYARLRKKMAEKTRRK